MVMTFDWRLKGSRFDSRLYRFHLTTLGKLFTHVPLSPSSIIGTGQRAMMPDGWEGNRRSGVALATRHRLRWFIHVRAQWLTRRR